MKRQTRIGRIPGGSWFARQMGLHRPHLDRVRALQAGATSETAHNAGLDTSTKPAVIPATPPATLEGDIRVAALRARTVDEDLGPDCGADEKGVSDEKLA